jgi:hypothetical protein
VANQGGKDEASTSPLFYAHESLSECRLYTGEIDDDDGTVGRTTFTVSIKPVLF